MAKIANVASTDTFNTWRVRSNESFDRLSQFAINNSSLYANTITANVSLIIGGSITANGSTGSNNKALMSNGSAVYWGTVTTDIGALANTNAWIYSVDTRERSALANTNSYIATKASTSTFNSALANTNAYIASVSATEQLDLANTNAYIATKAASANPVITGSLSANGSVGTAGDVLKSDGSTAYWDAPAPGFTTGKAIAMAIVFG